MTLQQLAVLDCLHESGRARIPGCCRTGLSHDQVCDEVARAAQLLRGIATAMSIDDFSVAMQWRPFAEAALQSAAPPKLTNSLRVHSWCMPLNPDT